MTRASKILRESEEKASEFDTSYIITGSRVRYKADNRRGYVMGVDPGDTGTVLSAPPTGGMTVKMDKGGAPVHVPTPDKRSQWELLEGPHYESAEVIEYRGWLIKPVDGIQVNYGGGSYKTDVKTTDGRTFQDVRKERTRDCSGYAISHSTEGFSFPIQPTIAKAKAYIDRYEDE